MIVKYRSKCHSFRIVMYVCHILDAARVASAPSIECHQSGLNLHFKMRSSIRQLTCTAPTLMVPMGGCGADELPVIGNQGQASPSVDDDPACPPVLLLISYGKSSS